MWKTTGMRSYGFGLVLSVSQDRAKCVCGNVVYVLPVEVLQPVLSSVSSVSSPCLPGPFRAIGMAAQRSTATPAVWQRAESFGVAGVEVDGMDVLAVRGAARRAIDRARRGEGPTLIEALTYRFRGHSVADPDEMRAVKQKEAWVVRDPIKSFEEELKRLGYASDETIAATRAKVKAVVDDAVKFAETSPEPDVQECGQFIFAPPYTEAGKPEPLTNEQLHQYAVALKQELDAKARAKAGDKTPQPSVLQSANPPIVID